MQPPLARQSQSPGITNRPAPNGAPAPVERAQVNDRAAASSTQAMIGRPMSELAVGQTAELSRRVTQQVVTQFGDTVGDVNPIHSDPAFAQARGFKSPIAHGAFGAGVISAAIGTMLPGPGTLYMSQDIRFLKPVYIGDTLLARVEVVELVADRNRARLKTTCINQQGEEVMTGEAWVKPPKERLVYESTGSL